MSWLINLRLFEDESDFGYGFGYRALREDRWLLARARELMAQGKIPSSQSLKDFVRQYEEEEVI